jgi:hypothetical protein
MRELRASPPFVQSASGRYENPWYGLFNYFIFRRVVFSTSFLAQFHILDTLEALFREPYFYIALRAFEVAVVPRPCP